MVAFPESVPDLFKESQGRFALVYVNTKRTEELEAEGYAREISRKIQAARKKAGFVKNDKIKLKIFVEPNLKELLGSQIEFIKDRVNAYEFFVELDSEGKKYKNVFSDEIKGKNVKFFFNKL